MKTKITSLDVRKTAMRELQAIPGVGPSLAQDLISLGITRVAQLKQKNPERLYRQLEKQVGTHVDRCVLYVFRCAIYYAETPEPHPDLLRWWNWKDAPKEPNQPLQPTRLIALSVRKAS